MPTFYPLRLRLSLGLLLLALSLTGCGGSGLTAVRGKVVFPDDSPLPGGTVVFTPADSNPFGAQGEIQDDGTFRLGTHRTGDGAMPGKYKVAIEPPPGPERNDDVENAPRPPGVIDRRFESTATSGLEYTVEPGGNDFTITVQKPGKAR